MNGEEKPGQAWKYEKARDLDLHGTQRLRSEKREVGLVGMAWHGIARLLTKALLRCLLRIKVSGADNLPRDLPFVIVANHCSHLDALLISDVCPARFTGQFFSLAAEDYFFDTPSKTLFASRWVNALPLRRGGAAAKALGTLRERLTAGLCGYIVFPEGTRSRTGELNAFKPGIGMLVAETEVAVIPCRLSGTHEIWPPGQGLPRPGKVKVCFGEVLSFRETSNGKEGWLSISQTLESHIRDL